MFMNYMDYVDDDTMVMFTEGQIARMHAALDGPRSSIGTSISCSFAPKPIVKEGPKDPIKDGVKDQPKDPQKEQPKDIIKDLPKDGPKDFPKDIPKDIPKDPPKELPKDLPKDPPKEGPKDLPKEFPKEFQKEFQKEFPKDVTKEGPFDPGPGPDPKGIFDPGPKSILEPPDGFPGQPGGPGPFAAPSGPAQPFVLATGSAPGMQPQAPTDERSMMMQHYAMILGTYASLHQRGLLDQQGMAGWQQAYQAYAALGGQ